MRKLHLQTKFLNAPAASKFSKHCLLVSLFFSVLKEDRSMQLGLMIAGKQASRTAIRTVIPQ